MALLLRGCNSCSTGLQRWVGASSAVAFLLAICVQRVAITLTQLRGARVFQERLLKSVIGARVSFYDTNPLGRILNRFAQVR